MGCDTKQNTLNHLREKNIIGDTRTILNDLGEFKKINTELTDLAKDIYGLNPGDKLLFEVETVTHTVGNRPGTSRERKTYKATPVDELFKTLDELYDKKDAAEQDLVQDIFNRKAVNKSVYIGTRYKGSDVRHYVSNDGQASTLNKKAQLSNQGFLNQNIDSVLYENLQQEFKKRTGKVFNINDITTQGMETQKSFYNLVRKTGVKGVEVVDSNGNLHVVDFMDTPVNEYSNTELDDAIVRNELTTTIEEVVEDTMSPLEMNEGYSSQEAERIGEVYSQEQINQMLEENKEDALKTFNDLLYPNEFNNDIFVSDREVNEQIRKCK